ncbi:sugar phosphate isomerase/epimerase family protein [Actinomyces procaprae]|uniref:sugar phosphate isomerase/epimerase family protein n=1 Tax=Actinomyces procaprae TaxID=2560010 RepID=UPI0019588797|nr:TIM barrel protein [Actinomyces procaprae]
MTYTCKRTSADWPIAAAMLPFPGSQDADEAVWRKQLAQVRFEGFTAIDLTDNWVRIADLSRERLALLKGLLEEYGLTPVAVSAIRRSVIDPVDWEGNLAYSHRVIDAAAFLGAEIVSVGLHRPLLDAQARALWFWTQPGPVDSHDPDNWRRAVTRLRELGEHVERAGMALSLGDVRGHPARHRRLRGPARHRHRHEQRRPQSRPGQHLPAAPAYRGLPRERREMHAPRQLLAHEELLA